MLNRKLSDKSLEKLNGVHPDLVKVVKDALEICHTDFSVFEGLRTLDRQKKLYAHGMTKTLNSKHIVQADGYGHAVDLYPYPCDMNKINRNSAQEISRFGLIAQSMMDAAAARNIKIRWGGDWDGDGQTLDHSFFDAPHFEIIK